MTTSEFIAIILFLTIMLFCAIDIFWWLAVTPITNYFIKKDTRKIQWKAEPLHHNKYSLYYRALPSDLNWFVRIFGSNKWYYARIFDEVAFAEKQDFVVFVDSFKTRKDIKQYTEEHGGPWIHP